MAKKSRAIPTWALYPGIALIAFVVWRKFSTGQSAAQPLNPPTAIKITHNTPEPTNYPHLMKFWELTSIFRTEPHILNTVLSDPQWLPFQNAYVQFSTPIATPMWEVEVPVALARSVASQSQLRFRYYPEMKLLRLLESDFFPEQVSQELNALEVNDRFGGSCMEEVLEKGSCVVKPKDNE